MKTDGNFFPGGRPRVLLLAEVANPEWVSVPLIGWSLAQAIGELADVHILTQIRNRDAFLRAGMKEGGDFTAIDTEAIQKSAWKLSKSLRLGNDLGWTTNAAIKALTYPWFEHKVWKAFGDRIKAREFDLVHRVTPVSPVMVSPISRKCCETGIDFIVGPLNGGLPWPEGFRDVQRREREWLSSLRGVHRLLPGRRSYLRNTSRFIVGSRYAEKEIPEPHRARCIRVAENGVNPDLFNSRVTDDGEGPLRISFIGRMVPYKGPDMLLEAAIPFLRSGRVHLHFIGDGPVLDNLRSRAFGIGVGGCVTFHGWLAHRDIPGIASKCQVMALPSVREFGGGVVLEAMALGSVPVVLDYGGPGEVVDNRVGFKIPLTNRKGVIADLRKCIGYLTENRDKLAEIGSRARDRVRERFTWRAKAAQMIEIYKSLSREKRQPS